jgi:hypothetical protein|uniref:Uncharacterized protein n=1 Tax=viral metagenome TaxID=1070528 RepID=A0A6C0CFF0_9ZZZZ
MGSQKTLTNDKYAYNGKEFQVYKTKKGVRLIKINNNFVNINNVAANAIAAKINDKIINDMTIENISELSNLDICDVPKGSGGGSDSEVSIDGEEYIIL